MSDIIQIMSDIGKPAITHNFFNSKQGKKKVIHRAGDV